MRSTMLRQPVLEARLRREVLRLRAEVVELTQEAREWQTIAMDVDIDDWCQMAMEMIRQRNIAIKERDAAREEAQELYEAARDAQDTIVWLVQGGTV